MGGRAGHPPPGPVATRPMAQEGPRTAAAAAETGAQPPVTGAAAMGAGGPGLPVAREVTRDAQAKLWGVMPERAEGPLVLCPGPDAWRTGLAVVARTGPPAERRPQSLPVTGSPGVRALVWITGMPNPPLVASTVTFSFSSAGQLAPTR